MVGCMDHTNTYIGSLDAWRQEIADQAPSCDARWREWSAHAPVDADGRVLKFLHWSLAGTAHSSGRRLFVVRVWTSSCPIMGTVSAYYMFLATSENLPPFWHSFVLGCMFMCSVCYFCIGECTHIMAQTIPQPGAVRADSSLSVGLTGSGGDGMMFSKTDADQQKEKFVEMLLATRVSATCAQEVRGWLKKSYINVFPCMCMWYLISTIPVDSGSLGLKMATVVYLVCTLPVTMILSGWLLYMHVPCIIVRERIQQMIVAVIDMRSHTRNYNVVMGMIQDAHEITLRVSALLTPTMAVNASISCTVTAVCLLCSVLPWPDCDRPQIEAPRGCDPSVPGVTNFTAPHAWQQLAFFEHTQPWMVVVLSACFFINSFIPLLSAARTSAAADELMTAVGSLRYEQLDSSASGIGRTATGADGEQSKQLMTRPDNLIRVNGLQQYAAELNSGQGIGFTFFKRRITKELVTGVLIRGLVLIALLSCVVLSPSSLPSLRTG